MTTDSSNPTPMDEVLKLCRMSQTSLLLIAPFIKTPVIQRILEVVPEKVTLTVITRWELSEIVAGVSDMEVWTLLRERGNTQMRLRARLHAKAYLSEVRALIGSSNLTYSALAGDGAGNLELLIEVDRHHPGLTLMTRTALTTSVPMDDTLFVLYQNIIGDLEAIALQEPFLPPLSEPAEPWFPQYRAPAELIAAADGRSGYSNDETVHARNELARLAVPLALSQTAKQRGVSLAMRSQPVIVALLAYLAGRPRRFGELRVWVTEFTGTAKERDTRTQTLVRWIREFLPEQINYSRVNHTEVLSLGTVRKPPPSAAQHPFGDLMGPS